MARLRGHRELDVSRPLHAKRVLTFGERVFAVGDVVPTAELGLSVRRVRQLHDQRKLGHEKPGERTGAEGRWQSRSQQPPPKPKQQQARR